jgi:hypothetical protein
MSSLDVSISQHNIQKDVLGQYQIGFIIVQ